MRTTVLSIFEGGYQPLGAINAATALTLNGREARLFDSYIDGVDDVAAFSDDVVAIAIPLFDSLTSAILLADRVKKFRSDAIVIFFGQYATINSDRIVPKYADYVVTGESEATLPALVEYLEGRSGHMPSGVVGREGRDSNSGATRRARPPVYPPRRNLAPSLAKYPQPQIEKLLRRSVVVGGLEATRGCHHKCTYCSVFAAYDGKVMVIEDDTVLSDADTLMQMGMTHLTFTDAEFFNTKKNGTRLLKELHNRYPTLTYDFTTRVDHIIENRDLLPELKRLGVEFITSALEYPKQEVLDQVAKEVTVEMLDLSVRATKNAGMLLNPTFIMFNPWIRLEDVVLMEDFVDRNGLDELIDPIQYETRLHLYKGSPLLSNATIRDLKLTENEFHYDWEHPDPRVDELYRNSATPPQEGVFKRCCLKC